MPGAIVGAIFAAISSVASVVGTVVGAITGVLATVLTPIANVLSTVVGAIVSPVSSMVNTLLSPLTRITSIIGGKISGITGIVTKNLVAPFKTITKSLTGGISSITAAITGKTGTVLTPIRNALLPIRNMVTAAQSSIFTGLGPVAEVSDLVRSVSTVRIAKQLLEGTQSVAETVGTISQWGKGLISGSIASVWTETVKATTALMTVVDDHFTLLDDSINGVADRLTEERDIALALVEEHIDTATTTLKEGFGFRIEPVEIQVAEVTRRIEDVPRFQQMMIRALG